MTKPKINNGFNNFSGTGQSEDSINVVAVNSAGTNVAGSSIAQVEQEKCNAFKNLFRIGNCPKKVTQGSADAFTYDATNPAAYTPGGSTSVLGGILKDISTYTKPLTGVNVADNPANQGITDSGWQEEKRDYTWWVVGILSVAVVVTVVLWIRYKNKHK